MEEAGWINVVLLEGRGREEIGLGESVRAFMLESSVCGASAITEYKRAVCFPQFRAVTRATGSSRCSEVLAVC